MKNHKVLFFLIVVSLLVTACVAMPDADDNDALPAAHVWSVTEISILKSLWLKSLEPKVDQTNRVVANPDAAKLGEKLFFEKRFSADGTVACATCHKPELYFTDGMAQSQGLKKVKRNAPTVVGASQHIWFFHDGRSDSLWSQATGPIENILEHGSSRGQFAHEIYNDTQLRRLYEKVFGSMPDISDLSRFPYLAGPIREDRQVRAAWNKMTPEDKRIITNIFVNGAKAIAAYETRLQPAPSRFDEYVEAVINEDRERMRAMLSLEELAGLKIFIGKGNCMICHNGPMFTDFGFHNIATPPLDVKRYDFGRKHAIYKVKSDPLNCMGDYNDARQRNCDELKYMVFDDHETMAAFKTPGLRNVSRTAPYMHGGQYATLAEVIGHYADIPPTKVGMSDLLVVKLTSKEKLQLEAFLLTLESEIEVSNNSLLGPLLSGN